MNQLASAIALAATKFEHIKDKQNVPYIMHCLAVMNGVKDLSTRVQAAAVMHDLIEDTDVTEQSLLEAGFHPAIVGLVVMLTHDRDERYEDYIDRISLDYEASRIKMADLTHNSCITRSKGTTDKDGKRLLKYHTAYLKLQSKWEYYERAS